jgi:integrase/recombinase XerC
MTLPTAPAAAPTAADLDAARLLLDRLGVAPADLLAAAPDRAPAPTFAEYIPVVREAVGAGTRRVYGSYWNKVIEQWGSRRLDEPTPSEIHHLAEHLRANVTVRRGPFPIL